MDFFSVGIDIGGTNVNWGIIDHYGIVLQSFSTRTQLYPTLEELSTHIFESIYCQFPDIKIEGIGIGAPAANHSTGMIHNASNLPWKGILPIKNIFEKKFNTTVQIENDARAAAWGEKIYGSAKGLSNYAFITLGTGVGCGIVLNEKLLIGENEYAGEIGHIIIHPHGRKCGCGRNGCLETYVSTSGIARTYNEKTEHHGHATSSLDVYEWALNNNQAAIDTFKYTAECLSFGIAQLITILGLKNVILFGGPVDAGDFLLKPLIKYVNHNLLHIIKDDINVLKSTVPAKHAAILGAAALTRF